MRCDLYIIRYSLFFKIGNSDPFFKPNAIPKDIRDRNKRRRNHKKKQFVFQSVSFGLFGGLRAYSN